MVAVRRGDGYPYVMKVTQYLLVHSVTEFTINSSPEQFMMMYNVVIPFTHSVSWLAQEI